MSLSQNTEIFVPSILIQLPQSKFNLPTLSFTDVLFDSNSDHTEVRIRGPRGLKFYILISLRFFKIGQTIVKSGFVKITTIVGTFFSNSL